MKIWKGKFKVYQNGLITDLKDKDIRCKSNGYFYVKVDKKAIRVHSIICECYHPNWFKGCIIHHLDKNGFNNNITNLFICKDQKEHLCLFHREQSPAQLAHTLTLGKISASFPRTKKQIEQFMSIQARGSEVSRTLPRTKKQMEQFKKCAQASWFKKTILKTEQDKKDFINIVKTARNSGFKHQDVYNMITEFWLMNFRTYNKYIKELMNG